MPRPTRTANDAIAELSRRIRARREELERTQEQVAYAAGVAVGWYASLERGQRLRPELPSVLAVAEALEMEAGDLFRGLKADRLPRGRP
ncbi:helix-turn-helix transcriptional regulator [Amycolatopsis thermoflava]|uniref:helix-turn-helix transcriptional regulator n=1 Tax=Amycolatopsis thermoflava TaxID=84480 RepID=UPI003830A4CA